MQQQFIILYSTFDYYLYLYLVQNSEPYSLCKWAKWTAVSSLAVTVRSQFWSNFYLLTAFTYLYELSSLCSEEGNS